MTDHLLRRPENADDTNARDVVRKQTDAAHAKLHLHSSFDGLFKGTLALADYALLVQRFHGFYAPLDKAIEDTIATMPDAPVPYPYVRRSDLLSQDMVDLKFDALSLTKNPQCTHAADIVSPATLGGVLYVIEGATLGAAQIDRAAQKLMGHGGPEGHRFWSWCRAQNKTRWSMANGFLEQQYAQGIALDDLVKGARDTFEVLAEWLAPLDRSTPVSGEARL